MIKEALRYLIEQAKPRPELVEAYGRTYGTGPLYPIEKPTPDTITVSTLTAMLDYIKGDFDGHGDGLLIQVGSPTRVQLLGPITGDWAQRIYPMTADCAPILPNLNLDQGMGQEEFNIHMRTCFLPSPDRETLLKYSASVEDTDSIKADDDGISQIATIRSGAASLATVKIPKTVKLTPYRTFLEVEQPEGEFIFRLSKGLQFRILEADGGAWRMEAMQRVKAYLDQALADVGVGIEVLA